MNPSPSGRSTTVCCGHAMTDHTLLDGERCYHPGCNCLSLRAGPVFPSLPGLGVTFDERCPPSVRAAAFADRHGRPDPAWLR